MTRSHAAARLLAVAAVLLLSAAPTLAQTTSFTSASVSYFTSDATTGVALADVNHDHIPDLIVSACGCTFNIVRVRLGDGHGAFGAPTDVTVAGDSPLGVAVGDLDGDGNPDIATADSGSDQVTILWGDGTGAFPSQTTFAVGSNPLAIAVADLDGDGNLDIAASNYGDDTVTILLNDGVATRSFTQSGLPIASGTSPLLLHAADVNGDTIADLVVPNVDDDSLTVILGDATGSFGVSNVSLPGTGPEDVAIVDVNGDNRLDLVSLGAFSSDVTTLYGDGSGGFAPSADPPLAAGSQPISIVAGDFNGDGFNDVIVSDQFSDGIIVYEGDGSRLSAGTAIDSVAYGPMWSAAADLNADGRLDLALGSQDGENTAILLNDTCCLVTVARAGSGTGTVSSLPAGVACGASCSRIFDSLTAPELTATPSAGFLFSGWSGACTGTATCIVPAGADAAVTATFDPLALSTTAFSSGAVGTAYSAAAATTNGSGPFTFTQESGSLPTGLALSSAGQISGTPLQAGTFSFTLRGTDAGGATGTRAYAITVTAGATATTASAASTVYRAAAQPVTLSAAVSSGTPVNSGSLTFTVRDSASTVIGAPVTAAVIGGVASTSYTLPAGTNAQTLSIAAVYNGSSDFGSSSDTTHTLVVAAAPSTTIAAAASAGAAATTQLVPVTAAVTSPNGTVDGGVVTFTVRDAGNAVVGSPVLGLVSAGSAAATYPLPAGTAAQTLTITAAFGGTGNFGASSSTAALQVTCTSIDINPASAPPLRLGRAFSMTFSSTSVTNAVFAIGGALPPGLQANGAVLSGSPTALGRFDVNVTATSTGNCSAARSLPLSVMRAPSFVIGAGSGALVREFDNQGTVTASFDLSDAAFSSGVRVAMGDITGDGVADIIASPGTGSSSAAVRVFDGVTGTLVRQFDAFPNPGPGGVFVAAGDVNGDGLADIVTARDDASAEVRVFDGRTGLLISDFTAYPASSVTGVHVAAGDLDADGDAEIIVGPEAGAAPEVRVFNGDGTLRLSFDAYDPAFFGGVYVAAGDVDGDGRADIVTGAGPGGGPHVKVFSGVDLHELRSFFAYVPQFAGGVRVAAGDLDLDGRAEVITAAGPGGGPHVRVWDGATGGEVVGFHAFDPTFSGGVFAAAPPAQSRTVIDAPANGSPVSPMFLVGGWVRGAGATTDSGVDAIHVWALPVAGGAPIFVGATTPGVSRPDVGAAFGGIFADAGFNLIAGPLPPGTYDLIAFAHNARSGTFASHAIARIVVP